MTLLLVLLILVPWSIYRQMKVHPVTADGLVKLPLIFLIIGVIGGATKSIPTDGAAIGYLVLSLLLSAGFGVWRGKVIPVWRGDDGGWLSQGNTLTLSLWIALLGTKVIMGCIAGFTGIFPGEHAGEIFLFIGVSFAVQNFIVAGRTIWNDEAAPATPGAGAAAS